MKTNLPTSIGTIEEAKAYLRELYNNQEVYHPEDPASDCFSASDEDSIETCVASNEQAAHMDRLMEQIYNLPGNDGRHVEPMAFDPCKFLMNLEHEHKAFMWSCTDGSGRPAVPNIPFERLDVADLEFTTEDGPMLVDWIREAEIGDQWENEDGLYTRTA